MKISSDELSQKSKFHCYR